MTTDTHPFPRLTRRLRTARRSCRFAAIFFAIALILAAGSCVSPERTPLSFLDSSEHHTYTGMVLINQNKLDDAEREFSLAIQLNRESSLGHAGIALVNAHRGNLKSAFESVEKAQQYARRDRERLLTHIVKIQLFTMSRRNDWIDRAEQEFKSAVAVDPRSSAAWYFMGRALVMNHEFSRAGMHFIKVLDLNDEYIEQADEAWKRMKQILVLGPLSDQVEEVVIADRVNRCQMALLLVEELEIEDLYRGLAKYGGTSDSALDVPDIQSCSYADEIKKIVAIGVKGLEVYPDGKFYPNDLVTRLNLAIALYDILVGIWGEEPVFRYTEEGPFVENIDYRHPNYKAVMTITSLDIMSSDFFDSSRLAPYAPLSGADALTAIRKLKDVLLIGFGR
ncbi:MAG: hypothetical protein RBS58_06105 [Syntrophales bacterium]|nr:hypothetical protein [Syntrophales bacterium]MDX9922211.1 hypothetical protein [Syntrophales bacterium]